MFTKVQNRGRRRRRHPKMVKSYCNWIPSVSKGRRLRERLKRCRVTSRVEG